MQSIINNLIPKAYAVSVGVEIPGRSGNDYTYSTYMSAIFSYAIKIGFALAVLMTIYAGYKYMMSQGNQTQISEAKEIFIGAVIGYVMLLLIELILNVLKTK